MRAPLSKYVIHNWRLGFKHKKNHYIKVFIHLKIQTSSIMSFDFKSEEDVKEYLKNIYIEYKFACESEKKGEACHLLGDYMESIILDFEQAANIYKQNCDDRKWSRSCTKFAGYKAVGKGCDADINVAYKYMVQSCELGDNSGCAKAGSMALSRGTAFEKDRTSQISVGINMLQKACDDDNELGCFILSNIYFSGLNGEIERNLIEAHKLSLKCCQMGNPHACNNVSRMYEKGEGVAKSDSLADLFKKRATALKYALKKAKQQVEFGQGIKT